ncbi:hypothetical protein FB451DRAFT_1468242 [Mycena latifolia]|nr:hypothetical protein FB451DRAFT_1468242 [Mycena latifolia]
MTDSADDSRVTAAPHDRESLYSASTSGFQVPTLFATLSYMLSGCSQPPLKPCKTLSLVTSGSAIARVLPPQAFSSMARNPSLNQSPSIPIAVLLYYSVPAARLSLSLDSRMSRERKLDKLRRKGRTGFIDGGGEDVEARPGAEERGVGKGTKELEGKGQGPLGGVINKGIARRLVGEGEAVGGAACGSSALHYAGERKENGCPHDSRGEREERWKSCARAPRRVGVSGSATSPSYVELATTTSGGGEEEISGPLRDREASRSCRLMYGGVQQKVNAGRIRIDLGSKQSNVSSSEMADNSGLRVALVVRRDKERVCMVSDCAKQIILATQLQMELDSLRRARRVALPQRDVRHAGRAYRVGRRVRGGGEGAREHPEGGGERRGRGGGGGLERAEVDVGVVHGRVEEDGEPREPGAARPRYDDGGGRHDARVRPVGDERREASSGADLQPSAADHERHAPHAPRHDGAQIERTQGGGEGGRRANGMGRESGMEWQGRRVNREGRAWRRETEEASEKKRGRG